jgi:hypothetical protein
MGTKKRIKKGKNIRKDLRSIFIIKPPNILKSDPNPVKVNLRVL